MQNNKSKYTPKSACCHAGKEKQLVLRICISGRLVVVLLVLFLLLVACEREPRFRDQGVDEKEDVRHMTTERDHAMPAGNVE